MAKAELTGFEGRVAMVTGAGRMRSLGRSIAVALGRAGCDVVLIGTGRDRASFPASEQAAGWNDIHSVAEEIEALGVRAFPMVADISDEHTVHDLFNRVTEQAGAPSLLVNNAASARGNDRVPIIDLDVAEWDRVQRVNLRGTFLMSREFSRRVVDDTRDGAILNISSIGGKLSGPTTGAYSASKAAIQSLTSSMAKELGPHGLRVNAICPGVVETERISDISDEQWATYVQGNIPMRRMGTGEDIADAALFLLSDQSSWITGQSINVDGGQLTIR